MAYLARARPEAAVHPVLMHGLGKALPKGSFFLVPFNCDVRAGAPIKWREPVSQFMETLEANIVGLAEQNEFQPWQ